jgi:hypothetical protein
MAPLKKIQTYKTNISSQSQCEMKRKKKEATFIHLVVINNATFPSGSTGIIKLISKNYSSVFNYGF